MVRTGGFGGIRSDAGEQAKDAFLGLMKICRKLGIPFWDYLGDRLGIPDAPPIPTSRIWSGNKPP